MPMRCSVNLPGRLMKIFPARSIKSIAFCMQNACAWDDNAGAITATATSPQGTSIAESKGQFLRANEEKMPVLSLPGLAHDSPQTSIQSRYRKVAQAAPARHVSRLR